MVVVAIIGLLASIILVSVGSARDKARRAKVSEDFFQIRNAIEMARNAQDKVLLRITGSGCSDCACRDDVDLSNPDAACIASMTNFFNKINLPLVKDPWGSPYLMDENESETPLDPCRRDGLRSAGPDRFFGNSDDIYLAIPFYLCF